MMSAREILTVGKNLLAVESRSNSRCRSSSRLAEIDRGATVVFTGGRRPKS